MHHALAVDYLQSGNQLYEETPLGGHLVHRVLRVGYGVFEVAPATKLQH